MKQGLTLFVLLALTWVALSGHYSTEPLILFFGVVSCLLVVWLARRMDRFAGDALLPPGVVGMLLRSVVYVPFLALKIVHANLRVCRLLLDRRLQVEPKVLRVKASQQTDVGRMIHANSITLTPGTVTLDVRGDELLVHALDQVSASSVVTGEIDRAVTRLEGGGR